jgi:E3 ubiquitin-protein ligase RAD18
MVKDNALRKKLGDMGISAAGSRQLMERRYTEWVTLWNANCDSKIPKGKGELKRELDVWERTQGGGAPVASRMNTGGNIRDKDFDGLAWSKNNDESFKQLVAEARKKKATKTEVGEPPKSEADSGTALLVPGHISPNAPEQAAPATPHHSGQQMPSENQPTHETPQHTSHLQEEPKNGTILTSPPKSSSQRRFFEDAPPPFEPPSSQHESAQKLDKDIDIGSDIAVLRPV